MNVSFPNVKADLSFSGGWIPFWLWACIFTVAMGWSPVMVGSASKRGSSISSWTRIQRGMQVMANGAGTFRRSILEKRGLLAALEDGDAVCDWPLDPGEVNETRPRVKTPRKSKIDTREGTSESSPAAVSAKRIAARLRAQAPPWPPPPPPPPASHQHGASSPATGGTSSSLAPTRGRQPYKRPFNHYAGASATGSQPRAGSARHRGSSGLPAPKKRSKLSPGQLV
ncbi:hypothetical protein IFM61606_03722 [Aspergillus udagawae]|nr:hypothetical protein IFM61606_03722 [Aspergillus udagawae]